MKRRIFVERDIEVRMRDGIVLRADVYRPDVETRLPVLLQRTPYGKGTSDLEFALMAADRGYAVVSQDTRGHFASEGDGLPFFHEKEDGYDTVEWAAQQPWADGQVGMFGSSYVGYTQWAAAVMQPPSLKTIVPGFTFTDPYSVMYQGGALILGAAISLTLTSVTLDAIQHSSGNPEEKGSLFQQWIRMMDGMTEGDTFRFTPLAEMPLIGRSGIVPFLYYFLSHPTRDGFWEAISCPLEQVHIPAFHIGGWYDLFIGNTWNDFATLTEQGSAQQKLLIGPWTHAVYSSLSGEVDFGVQASSMMVRPLEMQIRWFDHWLKGTENGILDEPQIRIFTMGENRWRSESNWPAFIGQPTYFYLHSDTPANSLIGNGRLDQTIPSCEPPDTFRYVPSNPAPTSGGGLCCWAPALRPGAFDQRPVEAREDVLVYTSKVLDRDLEITGPIRVNLWAASSAADTDFTAKLVDVAPCGNARNLLDGILRARFRNHGKDPVMLNPGEAVEYEIDLGVTSHIFKAGHAVRLEVSSSNFPRFDRNANTGLLPGEDAVLLPAQQTVFHEASKPSRLILPVVSR
ncbi:MAG: CocE/NonD family hydrolase [Chloroflexi bacterium]|nr:CocE/NonD family hydrolase [Chloroflexota bacterium]